MRIGFGYDVHRLVPDRKLILGGVEVEHSLGLLGHSDADVLTHAIMDALLGAAALGDIGRHFPDTSPDYKGADSLLLLSQVLTLLSQHGFSVNNIDATVAAQSPKLAPYIDLMKERLCKVLELRPDKLNIKATTTEQLGFEGREEGISAYAVCSIKKKK